MRKTTRCVALGLILVAAAALGTIDLVPDARASVCCSECQTLYEECNADCGASGGGTACLRACRDWFQQQCLPTCDPGC